MKQLLLLLLLSLFIGCESGSSVKDVVVAEFPKLGAAPEFELTDSFGEAFRFSETAGKVRVVSFFFSRCPSICPRINEQLSEVFGPLAERDDILFTSISVDPEHDTPEVLAEYAKKYRGESGDWKFLTGDKIVIQELLSTGFKLSSGMLPDEHNTRIVIIDREGEIRGFYQGMDKEHMRRFREDLPKFF